jgi:hypothetical protein
MRRMRGLSASWACPAASVAGLKIPASFTVDFFHHDAVEFTVAKMEDFVFGAFGPQSPGFLLGVLRTGGHNDRAMGKPFNDRDTVRFERLERRGAHGCTSSACQSSVQMSSSVKWGTTLGRISIQNV